MRHWLALFGLFLSCRGVFIRTRAEWGCRKYHHLKEISEVTWTDDTRAERRGGACGGGGQRSDFYIYFEVMLWRLCYFHARYSPVCRPTCANANYSETPQRSRFISFSFPCGVTRLNRVLFSQQTFRNGICDGISKQRRAPVAHGECVNTVKLAARIADMTVNSDRKFFPNVSSIFSIRRLENRRWYWSITRGQHWKHSIWQSSPEPT